MVDWFGVDQTRQAVNHWGQEFITTPDRIAIGEKQIQTIKKTVWLHAAIDIDQNNCSSRTPVTASGHQARDAFPRELKDHYNVADADDHIRFGEVTRILGRGCEQRFAYAVFLGCRRARHRAVTPMTRLHTHSYQSFLRVRRHGKGPHSSGKSRSLRIQ